MAAPGYTTGVGAFVPALWANEALNFLRPRNVYAQDGRVNRDYQGQIADRGDRVKINTLGPVTIFDYAKNGSLPAPEQLTDKQQELLIDQAKAFNFKLDDVDNVQMWPKQLSQGVSNAAYALATVSDQFVANLYPGAQSQLGTDVAPLVLTTATLAYETLVDLGTALDTTNCPSDNRTAVITPAFHGLLQKDNRFTSFGTVDNRSTLANGVIGEAAGFTLVKSNLAPNTANAKYKVQASHSSAISFAEQIVKMEMFRPPDQFSDAVKGLHVYGARVVRPECFAVATCNFS
jgi:N4-gp56 family major capsid protein